MAITDTQKVDYLWKKLGYAATKSDTSANKKAPNEAIASPLQLRGDKVMQQADTIPSTQPASSTGVVTVYPTSAPIECTADNTATANRTWKTGQTDWISPEFGSTYQTKVYIHTSSDAAGASGGDQVFATGSGNDDEWFFDYQSGVLHFIGTNLPNGISFTGKSVYIAASRYTGRFGVGGDLAIAGGSGSDTVTSGQTLTIQGTSNEIETSVSGQTFTIGLSNDVTVTGNLTVNGTTTTISSTDLVVSDKNIVIADGAADAAAANGAGITVDGASATLTYVSSNDRWSFNKDLTVSEVYGNLTGNVTGNADTATALSSAVTVELTGDVTGSATFTTAGDTASIATTIAADSVALGTDTTGNYVASIAGTANEVEVSGSGSETAAVTIGLPNDVTISNDLTVTNSASVGADLTVTGNLTINGTTTTISTTNSVVADSLIELNTGAGSNANDLGFIFERGSTGDNAAIIWDESADKFTLGTTTNTGADTGDLTISTGTLVANLEGNVIGDLTGNADTATALSSSVTVELTGDVAGSATFTAAGDTATISTTIQPNSVSLGTDTTGNYVRTVTGTAGEITVSGSGAEDADITIGFPSLVTIGAITIDDNRLKTTNTNEEIIIEPAGTGYVAIDATTGIIVPTGTTGERPSGQTGMMRFNTTTSLMEVYNGSAWVNIGGSTVTLDEFDGDDATTEFSLSQTATAASVIVSINGTVQEATNTYSVSGSTVTFNEAPATGDKIQVRNFFSGNSLDVTRLQDADGDTQIQVEESADEDVIRFDIAGTEKASIAASTTTVKNDLVVEGAIKSDTFYFVKRSTDTNITYPGSYGSVTIDYEDAGDDYGGADAMWSSVTDRFTPTVAGLWYFRASVDAYSGATQECGIFIEQNGTTVANTGTIGGIRPCITTHLYMNGTTDYVQFKGYAQSAVTRGQGATTSFFEALLVKQAE